MLYSKFSIQSPNQYLFLATMVLQLEVGEFPKGGPWGQINETVGNIASAPWPRQQKSNLLYINR